MGREVLAGEVSGSLEFHNELFDEFELLGDGGRDAVEGGLLELLYFPHHVLEGDEDQGVLVDLIHPPSNSTVGVSAGLHVLAEDTLDELDIGCSLPL